MRCPKCGYDNNDNARFCKECGTKLAMSRDEEIYEKSRKSESGYSNRKESYCEEYNDNQTIYQNRQEGYVIPERSVKKRGRNILAIFIVFFLLCIAAGAGLFLFISHEKKEKSVQEMTMEPGKEKAEGKEPSSQTNTETTTALEQATTMAATADTRAIGSTVTGISEESEEEDTYNLQDTGADTYDYADITSADDFNGVQLDDDYHVVYPKDFFKGARIIDGGYELYTADNQVTLTVTKERLTGDSEETLKGIHDKYENKVDYEKENNGVNITPGDDKKDGWRHTIVAGNKKSDISKGLYMIAAANDEYVYIQLFEYKDVSGGEEYCPQNYVIECLYRGCSFSFTSHPKLRSYKRYMEEGNDL